MSDYNTFKGDFMQEMLNKIILGDCIDVMRGMPDKSVDLFLTDIPFDGVNRKSNGLRELDKGKADIITFDLTEFMIQADRITNGSGYIFCGWGQISLISDFLTKNNLSVRLGFWKKTNPSPMNGEHIFLSGIEPFVYWKNKGAVFNAHCILPVFEYPSGQSKIHPTEKNIKLISKMIQISSNANDIVFDACMGSGTTAIACIANNRQWFGCELDPDYHRLATERVEKEKLNLFNTGG